MCMSVHECMCVHECVWCFFGFYLVLPSMSATTGGMETPLKQNSMVLSNILVCQIYNNKYHAPKEPISKYSMTFKVAGAANILPIHPLKKTVLLEIPLTS